MKALQVKLLAAMKAIDAVEKTGKNEKQGYKYVKATDVAHEVRDVLVANGISFGYDVADIERWSQATQSGGTMNFVQLKIEATFTDVDTGESVTRKGIGWGADSLEKAPYKAMTGAVKYILRMNFLIPDESDPENESTTNGNRKEIKRKSEKLDPTDPGMTETLKKMVAKPPAKDLNGLRTIGVKNGQKFLDAAVAAGKSVQEINNFLGSLGCESPEEILVSQAPTAKDWVVSK